MQPYNDTGIRIAGCNAEECCQTEHGNEDGEICFRFEISVFSFMRSEADSRPRSRWSAVQIGSIKHIESKDHPRPLSLASCASLPLALRIMDDVAGAVDRN